MAISKNPTQQHSVGPVYFHYLICLYMPDDPFAPVIVQLARTKAGDTAFSVAAADL